MSGELPEDPAGYEEVDLDSLQPPVKPPSIVPERWALCKIILPDGAIPNMEVFKSTLAPYNYRPVLAGNNVIIWNDPKTDPAGLESLLVQIRDAFPRVQIDFPAGK